MLDPILEGYVERDLSVGELVAAGYDEATVRRVIELVDRAEYKRRQAPPGVRVTSRAFGKDRRMPDHEPLPRWEAPLEELTPGPGRAGPAGTAPQGTGGGGAAPGAAPPERS